MKKGEEATKELNDLQTRFRQQDEVYKSYREEETIVGIERDRRVLFQGAADRKVVVAENGAIIASNDAFLKKGTSIARDTTDKLKATIVDLRQADEVRRGVCGGLVFL